MTETRQAGLLRVREWFAPAFAPDEPLLAALAGQTVRLNTIGSFIGLGKMIIGRSPARVLLLTDRSIHIASRKFSKRRFKKLLASYPLPSVNVSWDNKAISVADNRIYLNWVGYQLGGTIGTTDDLKLFLNSSSGK